MSFLWEGMKQAGQAAAKSAAVAGQKTKLRGEILLVDREIKTRKQSFGVELYDYIAPLAARPDFFAANDKMTNTIRGPFLVAQREIASLANKRQTLKEQLAQAEVARRAAFPTPASNFGEKVLNTGKAAGFASNEAKIKTEIGMVETQVKGHKQDFGVAIFDLFVQLEDSEGWLPSVRDIRTMYDKARQEVDALRRKIASKEQELKDLGGGTTPDPSTHDTNSHMNSESALNSGGGGLYGSSAPTGTPAAEMLASGGQPPPPASDPFAASSSSSAYAPPAASAQPDVFAAPTAPAPAPYDPFGSSTIQPTPAPYDPFAASPQPTPTPATHDPFAPAPAAPNNDPFAPSTTTTTNTATQDPFAGL